MSTPKDESEVIEIKEVEMFARRPDKSEDWCVRTIEHDVFTYLPARWPRARVIETVQILKRLADKSFSDGKRAGAVEERNKIVYGFQLTFGEVVRQIVKQL